MFKKSLRIRKKEDFDKVFRFGRVVFFEEIACRSLRKMSGDFRLGFSLSKKHLPRAVDRNRFRRVVSALVAEKKAACPPATDVVFSLRRKPRALSQKACAPAVVYFLKEISRNHK